MPFLLSFIADAIEAGLRTEAERCDHEQSPFGLDALDELQLPPILAAALRAADYGIYPEQKYPEPTRRPDNEGERCDLVLTPDRQPLAAPGWEPTLFDPPHAVSMDEAFWLEIKVVGQFTCDGPNSRYSAQLLTDAGQDVRKLSSNPGLVHAALLIVLYAEDAGVAEHDLAVWLDRCLQKRLPVGSPSLRSFDITERLGNRCCALGLYPVRRSAE